jgi:glutamine cyclotransferase
VPPTPTRPGTSVLEQLEAFPHDPAAFTQGLAFADGRLFESTGLHGQSQLREVDVATGRVLRSVSLPAKHFGEGMVVVDGEAYMLTWQTGVVFVFDADTLKLRRQMPLDRIGWGLTLDPDTDELIVSDGSHQLTWYDRATMRATRQVDVRMYGADGSASFISELNELEYVSPYVWAHKWHEELIYVIDPDSGVVVRTIDGTGLYPAALAASRHEEAVFNGVAVDYSDGRRGARLGAVEAGLPAETMAAGGVGGLVTADATGRPYDLYVTGKWWPVLARVRERVLTRPTVAASSASEDASEARGDL